MSEKETGLRCFSRSLAAPPPSASSFSNAGHSTRRFWKVSLKARGRGVLTRLGLSACAARGNPNPEGRPRARLGARRPPIRQWRPPAARLGSRRCTWLDQSLMQSRKGWVCVPGKGKFRIRTREADASTMASGCRAGACGHQPGLAGFQALPPTAASPGSCVPRGFLAGGCLRRSQAGSLACVEQGRNLGLHSQGKHFQGRSPACIAVGSPASPSVSALGERWLL